MADPSTSAAGPSALVPGREAPPEFLRRMLEAAEQSIAQPYVGITAPDGIVQGLYPLKQTGISTEPVRRAAERFLDSLSSEQRSRTLFPIDSDKWRRWSNIHRPVMRHGTAMFEMSPPARARAYDLLRASLSDRGFEMARGIMRLNETLAELTGKPDEYGERYYWLSIFGQPSATEPWGWQLDGHHLIINYFVLGDQVVMTPTFMGSEVTSTDSGQYAGTHVLDDEESGGLRLIRSLNAEQQARTILSSELPREVFTTAFRDNLELGYQGIRCDALESGQRQLLLDLIDSYVSRLRAGHAEVHMRTVVDHLPETHFAWMGGIGDDSVFYYRLHSPVILIEFDHQRGVALPTEEPTKVHVHTVIRTPNGNDYGKDWLRQHHEQYDHTHGSRH